MRRLITLLAAFALVAGPLAAAGGAVAKEHRDGRGEQRSEQAPRGNQGGGRGGGEYRGERRYEQADPRGEFRGGPRGESRGGESRGGEYRGEPRYEQRIDPRYDPRGYPPPAAYSAAPRRGGYLGPGAGEVIQNPASQRLRPPPRGYEWVRTPRGSALVSQSTGQVFDVVPY